MEHHTLRRHGHQLDILATVPGLVADGEQVATMLATLTPTRVALGVPPEDLPALAAIAASDDPASMIRERDDRDLDQGHGSPGLEGIYDVGSGPEPIEDDGDADGFAPIDPVHEHLLDLLGRFGATTLPSPDLDAAYAWALSNKVPVEALDMDDGTHSDAYVKANRFFDVIRAGRLQRRLLAARFEEAEDPHALMRSFDAMQTGIRSLLEVEQARESHMADRLAEMTATGPLVAIVPVARVDGILGALATTDSSDA